MTALLLFSTAGWAGDSGRVKVEISGIEHQKGKILLALYGGEDGFPTEPTKAKKQLALRIQGSTAQAEFPALSPGAYAISVFHDENDNGKLDTNFIGIPKEPIGTSNNAKGKMGPPKWKDAKFSVSAGAVTQRIRLIRL